LAQWLLGYPDAALADAKQALHEAREIGQAATLMNALAFSSGTHLHRGNYAAANAQSDELVALADEKGASYWKGAGMNLQGSILALTSRATDAVQMITSGIGRQRELHFTCRRRYRLWRHRLGLALHWRSYRSAGDNQRKVVRGRGQSHSWGNRAQVSRA
jgi:hypothetical protein